MHNNLVIEREAYIIGYWDFCGPPWAVGPYNCHHLSPLNDGPALTYHLLAWALTVEGTVIGRLPSQCLSPRCTIIILQIRSFWSDDASCNTQPEPKTTHALVLQVCLLACCVASYSNTGALFSHWLRQSKQMFHGSSSLAPLTWRACTWKLTELMSFCSWRYPLQQWFSNFPLGNPPKFPGDVS